MSRAFYSNDIKSFLNQSENEIFGIISKNNEYDLRIKQKDAWCSQIQLLKNALSKYTEGSIIFEYTIPRVGCRIDNIILLNDKIFVLEFKVGSKIYLNSAATQVRTYALDLANFHEESHNKIIVPILITTGASEYPLQINKYKNNVYDVIYTNGNNLIKILDAFKKSFESQLQLDKWLNSRYVPTPTIIDAEKILYNNHSVNDISQNEAAENLTKTYTAVQKIIEYSKQNYQKSICFITGVPGAGKTLAGLNIAIENQKVTDKKSYSCFLSGNQPLVSVLKEALARDNNKRTGISLSEARNNVKSFIQIIHHFRDASLEDFNMPPVDNVVIFDEAQRAWQKAQLSKFMNDKKSAILNKLPDEKRQKILSMSEPELLIEYMDRHKDWTVIVCLVGGGQDINTGEAGIQEWFDSLHRSYPHWKVYISNKITEEYVGNNSFDRLIKGLDCTIIDELHLSISLRSFRSEKVANFVHYLLNNEKIKLLNYIKK